MNVFLLWYLGPRAYSAVTASHRHAPWARGVPVQKVSIPLQEGKFHHQVN
jgi:hypothetical protein